jgi:predicted Na+-dependent transporter
MPVANSAAAWSQKSGGNLSTCLSLLLFSTIVSPLASPYLMEGMQVFMAPDVAGRLQALAYAYAGSMVIPWIVAPILTGVLVRLWVGADRVRRMRPTLSLWSGVGLLILNYSNGAMSMPRLIAGGEHRTAMLVLVLTGTTVALGFVAAWGAVRLLRARGAEAISLMYALSMKNSGAALVLATFVLPADHWMHLALIGQILFQHVFAALLEKRLLRRTAS